jgi:hypothetical protein
LDSSGWENFSTVVVALVAVALTGVGIVQFALSAALSLIRLKVYATSLALKGLPSLHLTPDLVLIVSVVPPSDHA